VSKRADALADRVEQGARELKAFAEGLSDAQWQTLCPNEGRTVGVLVHHVASAYMGELHFVQIMANGEGGFSGVTWEMIDQGNAAHAQDNADVTKEDALELLQKNVSVVAASIRELTDEQLDKAGPISLNWDAPLTTQYFIEEHPISHSFRHLKSIQSALNNSAQASPAAQ
jgi:hypothetical protein